MERKRMAGKWIRKKGKEKWRKRWQNSQENKNN